MCSAWPPLLSLSVALIGSVGLVACSSSDASDAPTDVQPTFPYPLDDTLRFQHLQAKSTHNSYHLETEGNKVADWRYSHLSLDRQLGEQGVRHVELDLHYNAVDGVFEIYHIGILDEQTTCRLFTECLAVVKGWSDQHRAHHPIVIQLEAKDGLPEDPEAWITRLHGEIRSVWPASRLITPALVQGDHGSLRDAVRQDGWPTLGELRGHVMFTLDNTGEFRDAYTHGGQSLDGRLIFVDSSPQDPFAAIAILNDPVSSADAIAEALAANMLVRTRADSNPADVLEGGPDHREAALASGAQFVSTDFPAPVPGVEYSVDIPEGTPSRCNPVTAPAGCTSEAIEDPSFVGE
jgi:Phosphoinositide phospholipase C, Ca2+-dependent